MTSSRRVSAKTAPKNDRKKNLPVSAKKKTPSRATGKSRAKVSVLLKDPHWAYCFWDDPTSSLPNKQEKAASPDKRPSPASETILRVWDQTDMKDIVPFDINIPPGFDSWYVRLDENKKYVLDVGYVSSVGTFLSLSRSGVITTPRSGAPRPSLPTNRIEDKWHCSEEEFSAIYALSCGLEETTGEINNLAESIFSPGAGFSRTMG